MKSKKIRIPLFLFSCLALCVSSCRKKSEEHPTPGASTDQSSTAPLFKIKNVYVSEDSMNFELRYSYEYDSADRVHVFYNYPISTDGSFYKDEIAKTRYVYSYFPHLTMVTSQFQSARDSLYYFGSYDSLRLDDAARTVSSRSFYVYISMSETGNDSVGVKVYRDYLYYKDVRGNVVVSKGTSVNDLNESTSTQVYDEDMDLIAIDSSYSNFVYDPNHFGQLPVGDFSIPGNNHKKLLVSYDASMGGHYKINWTFDAQNRPIAQTVIQSDTSGTSKSYRKFTY